MQVARIDDPNLWQYMVRRKFARGTGKKAIANLARDAGGLKHSLPKCGDHQIVGGRNVLHSVVASVALHSLRSATYSA